MVLSVVNLNKFFGGFMLVKLFLAPFIVIIDGFIDLLPILQLPAERVAGLFNMIVTALNFFPPDCWLLCLGTISFWLSFHLITGIIHFLGGLIPGVTLFH